MSVGSNHSIKGRVPLVQWLTGAPFVVEIKKLAPDRSRSSVLVPKSRRSGLEFNFLSRRTTGFARRWRGREHSQVFS